MIAMKRQFNKIKSSIFLVLILLLTVFFVSINTFAVKSTEVNITFTSGNLELKNAPTINFGQQLISSDITTYTAESINGKITVSDLRGMGNGWSLVASLSEFKKENNSTLKNASLIISNQIVTPVNSNSSTAPTPNNSLTLVAGGDSANVVTASAGQGLGDWDINWATNSTALKVFPGTAEAGASKATITWTLQATPTN